jgi:YbbR domain-containing protein
MKFLRWLTNNIDLKILSLVIALLVWLHVATDRTYETIVTAGLRFVDPPKGWAVVGNPPREVQLKLRGTGKQLFYQRMLGQPIARVEVPDVRSRLITMNLTPGEISLVDRPGLEVVSIVWPNELAIEMDVLDSQKLPIEPTVTGEVKKGYVLVGKPALTPAEAELQGGRSDLDKITSLKTGPIDIQSQFKPFKRTVAVCAPDGEGIGVSPDSVMASVVIQKKGQKAIQRLPVAVVNLPPERSVVIAPQQADVTVAGPESMIGSVDSTNVSISVDLSAMGQGSYLISPKVVTPDNFEVVSTKPDLIQVNIK